MVNIWQ